MERWDITDRIFLLIFDNQLDAASTFLRFQEHYESPQFKGRVFTLEEYKEWYIKNSVNGLKTGKFTYYTDWHGFNIPSYALHAFYEGKFDPVTGQEKAILDEFKGKEEPFYILGVHRKVISIQDYITHELAHGFFYTDPDYMKETLEILSRYDTTQIREELIDVYLYDQDFVDDEVQAHAIDEEKFLKSRTPQEMDEELREVFRKYKLKYNVRLPDFG